LDVLEEEPMSKFTSEYNRLNRKMQSVFGEKSWVGELNLTPTDEKAMKAFKSMLEYVEMLQKQVRGLEETVRNLR
jgi:hypothetical protein